MKTVSKNIINDYVVNRNFSILRIDTSFSVKKLTEALLQSQLNFDWYNKDTAKRYKSLGLQYSDPSKPYSDSVDALSLNILQKSKNIFKQHRSNKSFPYFNNASDLFSFVFREFSNLYLFRTRLLSIYSGYKLDHPHSDGQFGVRLHVPLETNTKSWLEVDGKRYHLPADGSSYLLNTSLPHRFGNEGATTRTHLVSVLYDLSTWNYPLLFIERIANYFDQNDLDLDSLPKIFKENFINRNILTCQLCKSKTHSFIPTYLKGLNLTHEVNKVFCGLCQSCSVELSQRIPKDINFPMSHDLLTDRLEWTNKELKF